MNLRLEPQYPHGSCAEGKDKEDVGESYGSASARQNRQPPINANPRLDGLRQSLVRL
jgi:hypothetical protein